jgi:hypothetical protein
MAHPPGSKYWTDADWDRHWLQNQDYYEAMETKYVGYAQKAAGVGILGLAGIVAAGLLGFFGDD